MGCTRLRPARASAMSRSPQAKQPEAFMASQLLKWRLYAKCPGQALIEMTFVTVLLLVLILGLIDYGRAIMTRQIITNLSREPAHLASRGTTLTNALTAVRGSADPGNTHGH